MDEKSKLIFWIFFISFAFIITLLFLKFYILRDYTLKAEVECDPQAGICFERLCIDGCEPDAEPEYYKIQTVQANEVSLCDPHLQECPEVDCAFVASCSETYCDEESVPEGETCSNPEDFVVPASEDGTEEETLETPAESSGTEGNAESAEIIE